MNQAHTIITELSIVEVREIREEIIPKFFKIKRLEITNLISEK